MSAARAKRGTVQHWGLTPSLRRTAVQPGPQGRHRRPAATERAVHPLGGCRGHAVHRCFGSNREGGLPMVRRLLDGEEPWAYENRGSVLAWAQDHVVLA